MRVLTRTIVLMALVCTCASTLPAAASARNAPGSPQWCAHHPKSHRPACRQNGTGPPVDLRITVSPDPVVETGGSDVILVLSVEANPVYAEQSVQIFSGLSDRCGGVTWISDQGSFSGATATATVDDDGNATVSILGASCAAGSVQVTADVEAGTDPTATATFSIDPPTPMI
jgi:hypothetical protein